MGECQFKVKLVGPQSELVPQSNTGLTQLGKQQVQISNTQHGSSNETHLHTSLSPDGKRLIVVVQEAGTKVPYTMERTNLFSESALIEEHSATGVNRTQHGF